jgi:hypothetical protein
MCVAEHLGICHATIYCLCESAALPHVRVVNSIRIRPEDLNLPLRASGHVTPHIHRTNHDEAQFRREARRGSSQPARGLAHACPGRGRARVPEHLPHPQDGGREAAPGTRGARLGVRPTRGGRAKSDADRARAARIVEVVWPVLFFGPRRRSRGRIRFASWRAATSAAATSTTAARRARSTAARIGDCRKRGNTRPARRPSSSRT